MSLVKRKSGTPELAAANDNEKKFRMSHSVEMHTTDVKMLEDFRDSFLQGKVNIENLRFLVVNTERNVAIKKVFPESDITFIEEDKGEARILQEHELNAIKANWARRKFGEKFNVIVALDDDITPRKRFLENIAGHGWLLCRAPLAGGLRASGKYKIEGVIGKDGPAPTLAKGPHGEMWDEVRTDGEFREASKKKIEDVATYNEAVKALKDAEWKFNSGEVVEKYRLLVQEKGDELGLKLLPWKEGDERKIYVLRKSGMF